MLHRVASRSVALLSLACLGCTTPSGPEVAELQGPSRRVSFDAVVLHVKAPELASSRLPPSLVGGLETATRRLQRSERPVVIPGTASLPTSPGEIAVIDAALGAAGDGNTVRVVRKTSRAAAEQSTLYLDVAVPGEVSPEEDDHAWTCELPKIRAYAVTPRILDDGALELELQAPKDESSLWTPRPFRLRVEPGQAVLLALAGPRLENLVPPPQPSSPPASGMDAAQQRLERLLRPGGPRTPRFVETRILVVLHPHLES